MRRRNLSHLVLSGLGQFRAFNDDSKGAITFLPLLVVSCTSACFPHWIAR